MAFLRSIASAGAISFLLAATPAGAATQNVKLRFAAVAGDQPVSCGTAIPGLGTTNQAAQLQDLRFYVSEVKLLRKGGKTTPVKVRANKAYRAVGPAGAVSLIDLENGKGACAATGTSTMNPVILGTVPKGTYTGVRFTIGVPFALNHTDLVAAAAPLNSAEMAWSWQSGRKFLKIEVTDPAPPAWKAKSFFVHLGSTGCTGNPASGQTVACKTPNRATVELQAFDPASQDIAVDLKTLLAGSDVTVNGGGAPGCMAGPTDPECGAIFSRLGLNWAADGTGTGLPTASASFFRPIDR